MRLWSRRWGESRSCHRLTTMLAVVCAAVAATDVAAREPARKGEVSHLRVGYQPYFTETWSGVVIRGLKLYERHLPAGTTVSFEVGLTGAGVVLDGLRAGRLDIGYLGLAPSIFAVTRGGGADLQLIAVTAVASDQCNTILVHERHRPAPSPDVAVKWLRGKRLARPVDTCADLFVAELTDTAGIDVVLVDQSPDLLVTSLRGAYVDAVAVWEPFASQLVESGEARRLVTGRETGLRSASFVLANVALIKQRPDVVLAWLRAEREAQEFLADPRNTDAILAMASNQTTLVSRGALQTALYAPSADGRALHLKLDLPFTFTPEVRRILARATQFLHRAGRIPRPRLPVDAIDTGFVETLRSPRKSVWLHNEAAPVRRAPDTMRLP